MGKKRNSLEVLQEQNHDSETSNTASQLKSRAAKTVVQEFINESNQNNENGKKKKKKKEKHEESPVAVLETTPKKSNKKNKIVNEENVPPAIQDTNNILASGESETNLKKSKKKKKDKENQNSFQHEVDIEKNKVEDKLENVEITDILQDTDSNIRKSKEKKKDKDEASISNTIRVSDLKLEPELEKSSEKKKKLKLEDQSVCEEIQDLPQTLNENTQKSKKKKQDKVLTTDEISDLLLEPEIEKSSKKKKKLKIEDQPSSLEIDNLPQVSDENTNKPKKKKKIKEEASPDIDESSKKNQKVKLEDESNKEKIVDIPQISEEKIKKSKKKCLDEIKIKPTTSNENNQDISPKKSKKKKKVKVEDLSANEEILDITPEKNHQKLEKKDSENEAFSSDEDIQATKGKRKIQDSEDSSSDEEIVRSVKKKRKAQVFSSDEDENPPAKKRKRIISERDSDSEAEENSNSESESSQKKHVLKRVCRVVSSEDEGENVNTPKEKHKKRLQELANKVNQKKGRKALDFFDDEVSDEHESDVDEDDLPMFENEDAPPEMDYDKPIAEASSDSEEDDFIVDDDEENDSENSQEQDDSDENTDDVSSQAEYMNPYMGPRERFVRPNVNRSMKDIVQSLSKTTKEDKQNKKRYKAEMGKYQFSVRSERNKAQYVDEKTRYKRNLVVARFDAGLKAERNLDKDDDEFFDVQELGLYGTQVQIFPHTKKRAAQKKGKCDLSGCGETFVQKETKIVGAKFLDDFNCKFMKKQNRFDKPGYYWICRKHMLEDADSGDSDSD